MRAPVLGRFSARAADMVRNDSTNEIKHEVGSS
jgi:hypothetical protein